MDDIHIHTDDSISCLLEGRVLLRDPKIFVQLQVQERILLGLRQQAAQADSSELDMIQGVKMEHLSFSSSKSLLPDASDVLPCGAMDQ